MTAPRYRSAVSRRAWRIIDFLNARPGQRFTPSDVRYAIGMDQESDAIWSEALRRARNISDENDECIVFCFKDRDGRTVLCIHPDDDALIQSNAQRAKSLTAQNDNFARQLDWGGRHATSAAVRRQQSQAARAMAGAAMMGSAMAEMAHDLIELEAQAAEGSRQRTASERAMEAARLVNLRRQQESQ